ncbi:hypothetical protein ENSA5_25860 [Enhygromyxa salina]|uniref:Lipoprotein n=1 Tax=Enhygromyxa salina TaxID=215803 RepID=A0A2S9YAJ0_9BACT|nr:hypothetical protein [Enhygromyxa salina]PRQ02127.1 hypothetical protein ENSA5_25860 [Enhygromyxa salina]
MSAWVKGALAAAVFGCALGCADADPLDADPLDAELIRELSMGQGSATGDARSGPWQFTFETESCDCPSFEFDGQTQDLCALAGYVALDLELIEGSGVLAIPTGPGAEAGVLTGAIESDGSFDLASRHDAATVAGPLESLQRMDGEFRDGNTRAMGWAGQRLIGEAAGSAVDCRWIGSFDAVPK